MLLLCFIANCAIGKTQQSPSDTGKKPVVKNSKRNLDNNESQAGEKQKHPQSVASGTDTTEPNRKAEEQASGTPLEDRIYKVNVVSHPTSDSGWFIFYVLLTGVLAVASIVSLWIVWGQARATRNSVETLLNTERPWLLVESVKYRPEGTVDAKHFCTVLLKNWGKTPAEIVEVNGTLKYAAIEELPNVPRYGQVTYYNPRPVVTEQYANPINILYDSPQIGYEQEIKMNEQRIPLIAFGIVRYKDLSMRKPYETKFCYCITSPIDSNRCGPKTYNSWT
jgi:hypothetical protein